MRMETKTFATKIGLGELAALHQRAFGSLKDGDARREERAQRGGRSGFGRMDAGMAEWNWAIRERKAPPLAATYQNI